MDRLLGSLVGFICQVDSERIPQSAVDEVVRHTLDTVGCGAGGYASPTARATRAVGVGVTGPLTASVYGEPEKVLVEYAALSNGTANRYLDFNDFGSSGHPSDMIPAILGMAEAIGATGQDVVAGIYIAYEIASRIAESVPRDAPWDQGLYCSLGVAGALSKMLRLPPGQTAHALSLAAVPNVPLRVTRFGELSQWKAAAGPYATVSALLAVRLAGQGLTGPAEPFEGKNGMFEKVWPAFKLDMTPDEGLPSGIERSSLKQFGACYWAQVGIGIIHELREAVAPDDVVSVEVSTCHAAWYTIGGGSGDAEQRWRPSTRETADHSLPFLMATMLVDGTISEGSFTDARLFDEQFLRVVDKFSVIEKSELTERATRDTCPTEVRLRLIDGTVLSKHQDFPLGHRQNPMSNAAVIEKFRSFVAPVLPGDDVDELQALLWKLPDLTDLSRVGELMRRFRAA